MSEDDFDGWSEHDYPTCSDCGVRLDSSRYGPAATLCRNHANGGGDDGLVLPEVQGETPRLPVHGLRHTTPEGAIESESDMKIRDAFPSNYLKAGDLQGRRVVVQVDRVEMETVGQGKDAEDKPVVYFAGKEKGLVLNVTNMNMLVDIAGGDDETDNWPGMRAVLYESKTQFAGKMVPCLRLDPAPNGQPARPTARPSPALKPQPLPKSLAVPDDDFQVDDDEVPF